MIWGAGGRGAQPVHPGYWWHGQPAGSGAAPAQPPPLPPSRPPQYAPPPQAPAQAPARQPERRAAATEDPSSRRPAFPPVPFGGASGQPWVDWCVEHARLSAHTYILELGGNGDTTVQQVLEAPAADLAKALRTNKASGGLLPLQRGIVARQISSAAMGLGLKLPDLGQSKPLEVAARKLDSVIDQGPNRWPAWSEVQSMDTQEVRDLCASFELDEANGGLPLAHEEPTLGHPPPAGGPSGEREAWTRQILSMRFGLRGDAERK